MPYVAYKDNEDGTYSFMDDVGQTSAPMAGPAAEQHVAKLKAQGAEPVPGVESKADIQSGAAPMPPPMDPVPTSPRIRGERAELSPEMLEAGAKGDDLRTAEVKAPNGSVIDAGGAPGGLTSDQMELGKLIDNGMSADDAKRFLTEKKNTQENWKKVTTWVSGVGDKVGGYIEERKNQERVKAGLPPVPTANKPAAPEGKEFSDEQTVAPEDRVQLAQPPQQQLAMATQRATPPRMAEMKVGEATAFTTSDPQAREDLKRAQQNQYEAVEQGAAAQAQAGQNTTGVLAEVPQGLTALEQERQTQEQSIADRVQKDHDELDTLRGEARQELDTGRFWKKKSNGEKFAGAIAMGLGAYVQAMGGGPNTAMQLINQAVSDDIMEQKENRQAARERFSDKRLSMADKKAVFQDERQNFLAKKLAYLDVAQSKVATFMQDAKTEEQKARAGELLAQIQKEDALARTEFSKVSHQVQTKVVQIGGGAAGVRNDVDPELFVQEAGGFALRKDVPPEVNAKFAGQNRLERLTKRMKIVGATVDKRADPAARAELDSLNAQWLVAYKDAEKMGALDKGTQEVGDSITGNPKSILGIGRDRVLDGILNGINSDRRNLQNTYGITPGQVVVVPDGKGGMKRVGVFTGQHGTGGAAKPAYDFKPAGAK